MRRTAFKLITIALTFLLTLMSVLPMSALAAGSSCSLSVSAEYDGNALSGFTVSAYRVAYLTGDNSLEMTEKFKGLPIGALPADTDGWNDLALTFEGYCFASDLTPDITGMTNDLGTVILTGDAGLYLIRSSQLTTGGFVYTSAPFFVYLDEQSGHSANLKLSRVEEEHFVSRKVLKVWDDDGRESKRPDSIKVVLYCDGEPYDTVTLDSESNWRYRWDRLPAGHSWTVSEKVPSGYTVRIEKEGITFVITNTRPGTPDKPVPGNKLPQTGIYWWPVPLLAAVGVAALLIGIRKRNEQ